MNTSPDIHAINSAERLLALFGEVGQASLRKEVDVVHPLYRAMIEASPFAVLATAGPGGLDASPRGDAPGFVQVQDERTLLLPERRGNNRVDSLRNILHDPRVALLFLIPGVGETLRVNGSASITAAPELLERFAVQGQLPKCVVVIQVESVFFQCARAIQRSGLWQPAPAGARARVPSPGAILQALTGAEVDGAAYDRELPARQRATLY
ncbi:MAG: pyridoxamine 5'-phosphate oxidase family protein [Polaromonas sp.]|nr:pyridoxamine 5'-phosphate oxidase family protein [Polaromonas sp.]